MPSKGTRFRMYQDLMSEAPVILEDARKAAQEIGLGAIPPVPGAPGRTAGQEKVLSRLREVVKDVYGDSYDCCPVSSPTLATRLACQAAFSPAIFTSAASAQASAGHRAQAPGPRLRCLVPRQKGFGLPAGFGPFPPKYKHIVELSERAQSGAGPEAPTRWGTDAAIVPLVGATYPVHGVSSTPVSMLASAKHDASLEAIAAAAEVNAPFLCGVFSLGPATPGCGFGPRDDRDVHALPAGLRELAAEFDVPCVIDDAYGMPFAERTPDGPGTSLEVYGHPGMGGLGLIVGTEDLVTPLVKELSLPAVGNGPADDLRAGAAPANPLSLAALLDLLTDLRDDPDRYARAVDRLYDIVTSGLGGLDSNFKQDVRIHKEYGALAVEVNYEDTWHEGRGIPVFTVEDSKAGTNLLEAGISAMGISCASVLEASIIVHLPTPGPARFELDSERIGLEMRGLAKLMEILGKRSGYLL